VSALLPGCGEGGEAPPGAVPETLAPGQLAGEDCLVIVLDALHACRLGCYGEERPSSPGLDALAARGVRFTHAWSQTSWTLPSTVSLMTGLYQETHGVRTPKELLTGAAETLAEAFASAGYATLAFTQNPYASAAFGLDQGFDRTELLPGIESEAAEPGADPDTRFADAVLAALGPRGDGPPRFVYCHFRRPHMPYDAPEDLRALFCAPGEAGAAAFTEAESRRHNKGDRVLGAPELAHVRHLYLAGVRAVDAQVARLLDGIDREHTFVLLTADHGEELGEHTHLGHNFTSFEEAVHIPLIAAHPVLAGGRAVDLPVMSLDVLPTLVELFGLQAPGGPLGGRSLLPELGGGEGAPRPAIFTSSRIGAGQMFAVTDGRWKYLVIPDEKYEALYDLQADPLERRDLAARQPHEAERLRALLSDWRKHQKRRGLEGPAVTDPAVDEQLHALGYAGEGGGRER